jgi:calcineurin-like phosphoesterase family protein/purple acid phosphatase-like protein
MTIKRLPVGVSILAISLMLAPAALAQTTGASDIVLRGAEAIAVQGGWVVATDAAASGGRAIWLPDAGVPKISAPSPKPTHSFDLAFAAKAHTAYRLWIRGRAQSDFWGNDSVFIQFSGSVTSTGTAAYRIGTTSATAVNLEDCTGCGISGWGWQDNGWGTGVLGPLLYFESDGPQTLRIQSREDGFLIDEVVLSPQKYLTSAPGPLRGDTTVLPPSDGSAPAPAVTLVRGPYLQQVEPDGIVIVWATRESGPGEVRYGSSSTSLTRSTPAAARLVPNTTTGIGYDYYQFEAHVTGLSADMTYTYQPFVSGSEVTPGTATFKTAPASGTGDVTFVVFGDSGTGSVAQRQLASVIQNDTFDLALHVGDIVYGTAATNSEATWPIYQDYFFNIYNWLPGKPFVPTEGNHDSRPTNGNGRAYLDLFVLPENGATPTTPAHAERHYSFDYGPVHFIVLDTEFTFQDTTRRAEQLAWAEADLAATPQPWKIAMFHRPPYSSGTEHGSDLVVRSAFGPLFERYHVDLALSGHDHDYERSIPMRVSTEPSDGYVTYVVTGGGGAGLYTVITGNPWTAFVSSRVEYVKAHVDACTLTLQAIGLNGAAFDATTISHCAQSAAPEVVVYAAGATATAGAWSVQADASAAGGRLMANPNAGAAKVTTAASNPANYFEVTFNAVANVPYRLWIRGRAQANSYDNDSVFAQFSNSVTPTGSPQWRIGTTGATAVVIEDCSGCGVSGWGWQDNGYGAGVLGPLVYFATTGQQRLRIQTREDGLSIDQIVLSPSRYFSTSPGTTKNDTTILTQSSGQ